MIPPALSSHKRRKPSHEDTKKSPGSRTGRDRSKSGSYADHSSFEKPTMSSSCIKRIRKNTDPPHDSAYPTALEEVSSTEINSLHVIPQVNRLESLDEDNSLASSIFVDEQIMTGCNSHKNCIHETCMMELKAKSGEDNKEDKKSDTESTSDQQLFNPDDETNNPGLNMNDDGSTEGEEDCECGTKSLERPLGILNREDTILVDQESQDESKKEEDQCIQNILSSESSSISLQSHFTTVKSESDMKGLVAESTKMTPSGSRSFKNLSPLKKRSESFKSRYLRSSSKLHYMMRKSTTSMSNKYRADCDHNSLDFGEDSSKSASFNPSPAVERETTASDSIGCYNSPSFSDYFSDPNTSRSGKDFNNKLHSEKSNVDSTSVVGLTASLDKKDDFENSTTNQDDSSKHVYPLRSRLKREKLRKQFVARQTKPRNFNQLPYEILTRILHYLNIQDVFRMQRVSRRIKDIVESYLGMIKRINFTNGLPFAFLPPSLDDKTLKKILSKTPRITHILGFYPQTISGNSHDTSKHTGLTYGGIIDGFRCCTKMRSVEIMNVELMSNLVQYLPYVKFHGMFRNRPDLWDSEYAVKLPLENQPGPTWFSQSLDSINNSVSSSKNTPIMAMNNISKNQASIGYYVGDMMNQTNGNKTGRSSLAQFAANYAHKAAIGASRQANLFEPQCELSIGEGCPSTSASSANVGSLIVNGIPDPDNIFAAAVAARPVIPIELANQNNFFPNNNNNNNNNPQQQAQQPHQQDNFIQPLIVAPAMDAADWINDIANQQNPANNNNNNLINEPGGDINWAFAALNNQQRNQIPDRPYQIQRLGPVNQGGGNQRIVPAQAPQNRQNPFINNPNGQAAAAAAAVAAMLVMRQNPDNIQPLLANNNNQPRGNMANMENRDESTSTRNENTNSSIISPLPSDQLIIPLPTVITSLTKLDLVSISINSLPRLDNIKYLHLKWVVFTSSDPFFHFSAPKLQSFVFNNCVGPSRFVRFVRIFAALSRATQLSRLELVGSRFVEGLIEHILDNYLSPSRNFRHLQRLILAGNKDVSEMDMGLLLIASQNSLVHVALQSGQSKNSLFEALTFSGIKLQKLESLVLGYQDPYQSRLTLTELNHLQLTESQDASMPISAITDRGIRLIHYVCPKLLSLHLRHCPYLSDISSWDKSLTREEIQQEINADGNLLNQATNPDNSIQNSPLKSLILENCSTLSLRSLERALFEGKPYPSLDTLVLRDMFHITPPSHGIFTSLFNDKSQWKNTWSTEMQNVTSTTLDEENSQDPTNDYRILWLLLVIADSLSISRIGYPSLSPSGVGLGSSARDVSHFNSINTIRSNDSSISSFEIFLSLRLHTYSSVLLQLIGGIYNDEYETRNRQVQDILLGRQPLLSTEKRKETKKTRHIKKTQSTGTQTCICSLLEVDAYLRLSYPDLSKAKPPFPSGTITPQTPVSMSSPSANPFDGGLAFHPFIASNQYNNLGELYRDEYWLSDFNSRIFSIYMPSTNSSSVQTSTNKSSCDSHCSSPPPSSSTSIGVQTRASKFLPNPRKRRATEQISLRAKSLRINGDISSNEDTSGICTRSKRKSFASTREMLTIEEDMKTPSTETRRVTERKFIQPLSAYYKCFLCSGHFDNCDIETFTPSKRPDTTQSYPSPSSSPSSSSPGIPSTSQSSLEINHVTIAKSWKARDACVDTNELRCSPQSNCQINVFTVCQSAVNKTSHRIIQTNLNNSSQISDTIPQVIPTGPSNVLTTLHLEKIGLTHIVLGWLPRLKNLTVDCCPNLKGILLAPKDPEATTIKSYVPSLRRVRIIRCPKFAIYNWLYTAAKLYPEHEENLFITYRPFGDYNKKVENTLWENATGAHVMVSNDFRHDQSERSMEEFHSNFDQLFREVMNFSEMLIRKNLIKVQHPDDSKYLTRTEHGIGWDLITDLPWIHEVCCSYLPCQHFCRGSNNNNGNSNSQYKEPNHQKKTSASTPNSSVSSSHSNPQFPSVAKANLSNIRFDQVDQLYEILAEVKYQDWNRETQISINQRNLGSFKIAKKGIHYHVQHRDIITSHEREKSIADWVQTSSSFTDYLYTDEYLAKVHPVDDFNVYPNQEARHFLPPKPTILPILNSSNEGSSHSTTTDCANSSRQNNPTVLLNLESWQRLLLEQDGNMKL